MTVLKNYAIFIVSVLSTLLVLDCYMQLAEIQTPMETRIDSEIGPTYIPNKNITRFNEGFYIGRSNEFGYLGESRPPSNESGEIRILMLGDSYVMGNTLFERHHFGTFIKNNISERLGRSVATLNFGKADFSLPNIYAYYRKFASQWDHDLALIFLDEGDLLISRQLDRDLYPYCAVKDGQITITDDFKTSTMFRVYNSIEPVSAHSAIFRLAYNVRKVFAQKRMSIVLLDKLAPMFFPPRMIENNTNDGGEMTELVLGILNELSHDPRNIIVLKKNLRPDLIDKIEQYGFDIINLGQPLDQMIENDLVWRIGFYC